MCAETQAWRAAAWHSHQYCWGFITSLGSCAEAPLGGMSHPTERLKRERIALRLLISRL